MNIRKAFMKECRKKYAYSIQQVHGPDYNGLVIWVWEKNTGMPLLHISRGIYKRQRAESIVWNHIKLWELTKREIFFIWGDQRYGNNTTDKSPHS